MSLLSGIRYTSKAERIKETSHDSIERREKKHKSHSHIKKHHKKKKHDSDEVQVSKEDWLNDMEDIQMNESIYARNDKSNYNITEEVNNDNRQKENTPFYEHDSGKRDTKWINDYQNDPDVKWHSNYKDDIEMYGNETSFNLPDSDNKPVNNQLAATLLKEKLKAQRSGITSTKPIEFDPQHASHLLKLSHLQKSMKSNPPANESNTIQSEIFKLKQNSRQLLNSVEEDDMDETIKQNILRLGNHYKGTEVVKPTNRYSTGVDEDDDMDMTLYNPSKPSKTSASPTSQDKFMKQQLMNSYQDLTKMKSILSKCSRCLYSKRPSDPLIIFSNEHLILRLKPSEYSLTDGHCEIIPTQHLTSWIQSDQEIWNEIIKLQQKIQNFLQKDGKIFQLNEDNDESDDEEYAPDWVKAKIQQGLQALKDANATVNTSQKGCSVLFIETATYLEKLPHAAMDIIPVPFGYEEEAKLLFRQAFTECDEEWSQHKKIIDLMTDKPLIKAVPKNFPYMTVQWPCKYAATTNKSSLNVGLVHVIENIQKIPRDFCLDIVASLLKVPTLRVKRKSNGSENQSNNEKDINLVQKWKMLLK